MRYELTHPIFRDRTCQVSLASDDPNKGALLQFSGNGYAIERVRDILANSYGAFGHQIGDATTPIDLHYAMNNTKNLVEYQPQLLEGEDLVRSYDPGIPPGAVS